MCATESQPASNLIAEARGVLDRNHGRWPEADWQTLDRFVREVERYASDMEKLLTEFDDALDLDLKLICSIFGLGEN